MNKHARFTSNTFRLAVLALAMAGAGSAIAASINAVSTSSVVAPIKITKSADLAFGTFSSSDTGGTVTIGADNVRSITGDVTLMAGGTPKAAKFDVTGQAGLTYSIGVTATDLKSGDNIMAVAPVSSLPSGLLDGTGAQSFFVGGTVTVAANQAAGEYTGSVTATVQYN